MSDHVEHATARTNRPSRPKANPLEARITGARTAARRYLPDAFKGEIVGDELEGSSDPRDPTEPTTTDSGESAEGQGGEPQGGES